jgi:hypothetical protein
VARSSRETQTDSGSPGRGRTSEGRDRVRQAKTATRQRKVATPLACLRLELIRGREECLIEHASFVQRTTTGHKGAQGSASSRTLASQAAFQRHVLGPKSRFSWKGASDALPLASTCARICAELLRWLHAAFPSPRAQTMPHERTGRAQNPPIPAPRGRRPGPFPHPGGPRAEYFRTGGS